MGKLRTKEQLKELFNERKRIQQKRIEQQKKRYRIASEIVKKALADKQSNEQKQTDCSPINMTTEAHFENPIKPSRYTGRFTYEDDVYQSWDEIKQAEQFPNETGRLNWDKLFQIIEQGRKEVELAVKKYRKENMKLPTYKKISVTVLDDSGEEIKTFQSIALASIFTNDSPCTIKKKMENGEISKRGYYYKTTN